MRRPGETTPRWLGRVFLAWALAYGLAALAGGTVLLLVVGSAMRDLGGLSVLPLTVPVVALFALPGFLLLRPLLHVLRKGQVVWFAASGALAAWGSSIVAALVHGPASLQGDAVMLAALGAAGATAGACYRVVERAALQDSGAAA